MKLIIDIDEDVYKAILENGYIYDEDNEDIAKIIKDGTLLEEKIGHWIRQKGIYGLADTCECSVCGRTIYAGNEKDLEDYPYCHCGAKMKGE